MLRQRLPARSDALPTTERALICFGLQVTIGRLGAEF